MYVSSTVTSQYVKNVQTKDQSGRTALHFAAWERNSDVIRLLLKNGCNPEVKNKEAFQLQELNVKAIKIFHTPAPESLPYQEEEEGEEEEEKEEEDNLTNNVTRYFDKLTDNGKTPLDLIEEEGLQHHRDKRKRARTILKEYREYWQKGLPIEIKELDKKSAKVFASLLEEEGYDHYEARVMLAGEQGTGKTTIARYLVGKGPTKIRMSTDGIDLYNGLSFIDRETEEWMNGKQGFKLSEIAISRSLRQSNDKSSNMYAKYKLTDREKNYLDTAGHPKIKQKVVIPLSVRSESKSDESDKNVSSSNESYVSATESFCIHPQKDPGLVDNLCLENKYSNSFHDIGKAAVSRETKTKTKATKEIYPVIARESDVEILPRERKVVDPQIVGRETIPSSFNDNIFPRNESSNSANENGEFFRSEIHSKPHVESKEIGKTIEVVKDRGIIGKLKKLFGIQKDVTEVKVSMTKDRFLKESMKVGKKKLHQKKIAPVIIWDFGGQDVFYSTHQTFLTYRAIYLLVLDGSRNLDDPCPVEQYFPGKSGDKTARDYLRFWINTIVTYCKGSGPGFPKIMIVLTHKDKLEAVSMNLFDIF
ncbi:Hypothetical predicted protein [Mytilus galloprovincialis]|uniref:Non-specific serine/threonine protein kinase n=1 Tax=Mytilus galloprovincialis TaxID=29158 RepID=A0A8B6F0U8_MYTGA|nr:Hypothetical predicted protein [Mytilus galloprovincialis]